MMKAAEVLLSAASVAVLVRVCWTDFDRLKIYNRDVVTLLVLFVLLLFVAQPSDSGLRVGLGFILFMIGMVFWMAGRLGAGDVKLLGVSGLAVPAGNATLYTAVLLGCTLLLLASYRLREYISFVLPSVGSRLGELADSRRVPYGIPIGAATVLVLLEPLLGPLVD